MGSSLNGTKCFKCHGLEHIVSECPNMKIITLVKDYVDGSEGEVNEQSKEGEEEMTNAAHGMFIVVQCSLKVSHVAEDENWIRKNVFHIKCTFQGKV